MPFTNCLINVSFERSPCPGLEGENDFHKTRVTWVGPQNSTQVKVEEKDWPHNVVLWPPCMCHIRCARPPYKHTYAIKRRSTQNKQTNKNPLCFRTAVLQEVNEVFHVQACVVLITYFPDFHNAWEYIIFLHFGQGTSEKLSGSWDCAPVDLRNTEVALTLPPSHVTRASCGETLWGCSLPMWLGVSLWFSEMSQWCWEKKMASQTWK